MRKGIEDNPLSLEDLSKIVIPPELVGKIFIGVNKKNHSVDVRRENISREETKGILRDVLNKL